MMNALSFLFLLSALSPMHEQVYQEQELKDLEMRGQLSLHHCSLMGFSKINGAFKASGRSYIEDIAVNGSCTLIGSCVKGNLFVRGPLHLEQSVVQEEVVLLASEATLSGSRVQNVTFKASKTPGESLYVKKGTRVEGNIRFESKKGTVYLGTDAQLFGAVVGGKIVRVSYAE